MVDQPTPPTPKPESVAPTLALVATGLAGAPLAVMTVSLLNRTVFAAHPLTPEEATAFGTVGAALLGYAFHIAQVLINRKVLGS